MASKHLRGISVLGRRIAGILALALFVPFMIAACSGTEAPSVVATPAVPFITTGPRTILGLHLASSGGDDAFVAKLVLLTIQLSTSSQTVNENVGNATITAQLSAASNYTVTVTIATSNGTALADADYTAVNTTLTFPPGVTTVSVAIPIIDDPLNEPDQVFNVTVSNPTNATLGTTTSTTITIVNDDPPPSASWMTNIFGATESSGFANVIISIDTPSDYVVTVQYATSDITARAGSDYTATSGTATINPGQIYVTINIPITNDTVAELDEDFALALSNPINTTLHYDQAIVRIHNNGPAPSPTTTPTTEAYPPPLPTATSEPYPPPLPTATSEPYPPPAAGGSVMPITGVDTTAGVDGTPTISSGVAPLPTLSRCRLLSVLDKSSYS